MQEIEFAAGSGGTVRVWRGFSAKISVSGVLDTSGTWSFFADNDSLDGPAMTGSVSVSSGRLVITVSDTNTAEIASAIQGRRDLPLAGILSNGTQAVRIPIILRNRPVAGTPSPVASYYTKSEVDSLIAALPERNSSLVPSSRTVNGKALSGNITLDAGDIPVPVEALSGTAVPGAGKIYTHTLTENTTISLTAPAPGYCNTLELHLKQAAAVYSVSWPAVWWSDDTGKHALSNPPPEISTANTLYCIVLRFANNHWLGNLAYTEDVVSE